MIIKLMSIVIATCVGELFVLGAQNTDDPLFLFISDNKLTVAVRLLLVALAVIISFKQRFTYRPSRHIIGALGLALIIFGSMGAMSQTIIDEFSALLKIMDFLLMILVGIIFSLAALGYQPGRRQLVWRELLISHIPKALAPKLSPYLTKSK